MSNSVRAVLGILVVALAVVLLIALRGGGDDEGNGGSAGGDGGAAVEAPDGEGKGSARAPRLTVPTIVVRGGRAVGGPRVLTYVAGDRIAFQVESDVSDEIHVHGYDIAKDVEAGGSVRFDFPAKLHGIFEVELEHRGEQIAELRVNP